MLIKLYNNIFFLTVTSLNFLSNNLIIKPFLFFISFLPKSEKISKLILKNNYITKTKPNDGTNSHYAFQLMMWSFSIIIIGFITGLTKLINSNFEQNLIATLIVACVSSIVFNYRLLYYKDIYESYFKSFVKEKQKLTLIILTVLFHLIPLIILIGAFSNVF